MASLSPASNQWKIIGSNPASQMLFYNFTFSVFSDICMEITYVCVEGGGGADRITTYSLETRHVHLVFF